MTAGAPVALGLDAGGTQTRWAVVAQDGAVLAGGELQGFSALQVHDASGRQTVAQVLDQLAQQVGSVVPPVRRVCAGVTGVGGTDEPAADVLRGMLAPALGLDGDAVHVTSDIEVAYRDVFAPGAGYLVYAGTGSMAAYFDTTGTFHRAGGRGGVLDDAGGGYWIAREALRHIWRTEDERPGAWRESVMAQRVFEQLGGSDWPTTRRFVYGGERGAMGRLALAVAAAADADPLARQILHNAGTELARLGRALSTRFGPRPLALGGRAARLHPLVAQSLRAAMPEGTDLRVVDCHGHIAAARMAAAALCES